MKIRVSIVLFILLFHYSMNSNAQTEKHSHQYRPAIEFSAQRYEYLEDGQLKNFLGKNHEYCYELESGFRFRSSGTSWTKNFSIYFGYKEYNNVSEVVRYNMNYLTHGYSMVISKKIHEHWNFEIPVDVRGNFLIYSTREYYSNPDVASHYPINFVKPLLQIKAGAQLTHGISENLFAGLFLKGGYALSTKHEDYPYVKNIHAGDIGFHAYAGVTLRYHL